MNSTCSVDLRPAAKPRTGSLPNVKYGSATINSKALNLRPDVVRTTSKLRSISAAAALRGCLAEAFLKK
jgi:hypothetical protein